MFNVSYIGSENTYYKEHSKLTAYKIECNMFHKSWFVKISP